MKNVVYLKEVCLDYKPGDLTALKFRLKALEIYTYIEQVEKGEIKLDLEPNGISLCDFAILNNAI